MKSFLIKKLIIAAAVVLTFCLFPRVFVNRFTTALLLALILLALNYFVKPIPAIFTVSITVITLGRFLFIIKDIVILLAGKLVTAFRTDPVGWGLQSGLPLFFLPVCRKLLLNRIIRRSNTEYAF